MANFEPKWDLIADTNTIKEGQSTYFRLKISKNQPTSTDNSYELDSNEYLNLIFNITGSGSTLEERDFNLYIGEDINSLVNISNAETGTDSIKGTHSVNLNTKLFEIDSSISSIEAYFFKIECPEDGIWDGPESLTFNIISVNEITLIDGQIANTVNSGVLGTSKQILNYNNSDEIWVTPNLVTHGTQLYTIGEIGYGAESRLFVQAFGSSRNISGQTNIFMPSYEILEITTADIPSTHITGSGTILVPDLTNGLTEEITLLVKDINGNMVNTGLKFNGNNGQITQTMLYDSEPIDAYFKVKIVSPEIYFTTEYPSYYVGKKFRAYQTWIAESDVSDYYEKPITNHLYQLKDTSVYPYIIKTVYHEGTTVKLFESDKWYDLGIFNVSLGQNIINNERMFRIVLNDNTSSNIVFETDENLGEIHVGEYFGHTVYPKIKASGSDLITFELVESTSSILRKYGLDLSADGYLIGTAYATSDDFSNNDDISLEFDIIANGKNGKNATKTFKLKIIRGFGQNYISSFVCPSLTLERDWFSVISSKVFSDTTYYRESDPRYGIKKIPRILLKENFVDSTKPWVSIKQTASNIRNGIINTSTGAPVPDGAFNLVLGNYKLRSAIDNNGTIIYDVLYREIHPEGTRVSVSLDPYSYSDYTNSIISEIFGLRQNIFEIVGQDITNLTTDPTDMSNRGIIVPEISGLSEQMTDTVPRYFNHPYLRTNTKVMYFPCIPVAYFPPGQGEIFFNTLIQNNEHTALLNTEFEISNVEFFYFVNKFNIYENEKFNASLKAPNLFQ